MNTTDPRPNYTLNYQDQRSLHFHQQHIYHIGLSGDEEESLPPEESFFLVDICGKNHQVVGDPNRPPLFPTSLFTKFFPKFYINQNGETIVEIFKNEDRTFQVISWEKVLGYDLILFPFHFFYIRIKELITLWPIFVIGGQTSL